MHRGKPCLMEKPMARNAECVRMSDTFRSGRVPLFVAYCRRALPRFLKVRQPTIAGAGLFLNLGSHCIDLLEFFLGESLVSVDMPLTQVMRTWRKT